MKPVLILLLSFCAVLFSCQSPETINPLEELEVELKSCHLSAKAVVQYREAQDENDPFYYLSLLDANGKEIGDVYTSIIQDGKVEVGDVLTITFHYEVSNGESYVSACGDDPAHQPTAAEMAKVVVCDGIS